MTDTAPASPEGGLLEADAPVLDLRDIAIRYDRPGEEPITIADDYDLRMGAGDFHCLAGRSGSGKTSILRVAAGLVPPTEGRVLWQGLEMGWLGRFVQGIERQATSVGDIRKPGYSVHDVYARWRPTGRDDYTLSVSIRNLFDKDYLDHATTEDFQSIPGYGGIVGSREPGRELRIGLAARF